MRHLRPLARSALAKTRTKRLSRLLLRRKRPKLHRARASKPMRLLRPLARSALATRTKASRSNRLRPKRPIPRLHRAMALRSRQLQLTVQARSTLATYCLAPTWGGLADQCSCSPTSSYLRARAQDICLKLQCLTCTWSPGLKAQDSAHGTLSVLHTAAEAQLSTPHALPLAYLLDTTKQQASA